VSRALRCVTCLLCLLALTGTAAAAVLGRVANNPADRLLAKPIEPFAYDWSKSCRHRPQAGTVALRHWLERHVRGESWGIMRCEKLSAHSYSLHSEGRALDWHLDVTNARDRRAADALVRLLLAPDRAGNVHALARRMGVQEIIWNCQGWFGGDGGMRPYSVCYDKKGRRTKVDDTTAHRDHIHFGLNWSGARMRTSFWQAGTAR
jgi:hypothetical protein